MSVSSFVNISFCTFADVSSVQYTYYEHIALIHPTFFKYAAQSRVPCVDLWVAGISYALPTAVDLYGFLDKRTLTPDNTCGAVAAGNNKGYTCDPTLPQGGNCCSANGYCGQPLALVYEQHANREQETVRIIAALVVSPLLGNALCLRITSVETSLQGTTTATHATLRWPKEGLAVQPLDIAVGCEYWCMRNILTWTRE